MKDREIPHRVLVVDDDPTVRTLLKQIFTADGHEVHLCEDGQAALEKFEEGGFSLLVTDIQMPRKDGLELLAGVRARDPDIFVILISGNFTPEALEACRKSGRTRCLTKPLVIAELKEAVREARPKS